MFQRVTRPGPGSPTEFGWQIAKWAVPLVLVAITIGCVESPPKDGNSLEQVVRESSASPAADADNHAYTNRLIHETSPYLLQHAHNPVNWYPWGDEAFEKAKNEGKPVFLSVGYSTCYWCHVMERESFENEDVAAILNEHFVAIKVDREELPDVDEQYMLAAQLVTGRGGWPNSVWLTPDGRPWMAGSYFPPEQFKQVLNQLATVWATRRADVEQQANRLSQAIRQVSASNTKQGRRDIDQALVDQAIATLKQSYDSQFAGFGSAPKFPPHASLRLLIHEYRRAKQPNLLRMTASTLDAMASGGVRDHIGGGFHRYATDRRWFLPHFEKMLYDNAQLMRVYTDGYLITGDERYREVVEDIYRWLDREMTAPGGAFYSALDSESDGEEGKFYVWDYDEVLQVLGPERGQLFAEVYGFQPQGNWVEEARGHRPGTNIPFLPNPIAEAARKGRMHPTALKTQLQKAHADLLTVRNRRPSPHRDDKILTSWNGLMISSLANAGRALNDPRYVEAAANAAQFILDNMRDADGRLLRVNREGQAKQPGYLDDYAFFADGLLELHAATSDERWLSHAKELSDMMLDEFEDPQKHAFFFSSSQHDDLLMRSKYLFGGGNLPSSNGVAVQVLLRLGQLTGESQYFETARRTLESLADVMWQRPQGNESLALSVATYLEQLEQ